MNTNELQREDDNDQLELDLEDEIEQDVNDTEVDDELPSDSEPDSDADHEEKDEQQPKADKEDKVEERIGELTRKRREAERLAEERQEKIEEMQRAMLEQNEPQVPDLPDPDDVSDSEFRDAVAQRDEAIRRRIDWQQQKQQLTQQDEQRKQQSQLQSQQEMQSAVKTYNERAKQIGVSNEELSQSAQIIGQVGLSNEIAMHILNDDLGPAITRHLGKNVQDLLEIAQANPIQAALYIERNIKPRLSPKRKTTSAKKPPQRVKGGTPNKSDKYPLTGGRATFE